MVWKKQQQPDKDDCAHLNDYEMDECTQANFKALVVGESNNLHFFKHFGGVIKLKKLDVCLNKALINSKK